MVQRQTNALRRTTDFTCSPGTQAGQSYSVSLIRRRADHDRPRGDLVYWNAGGQAGPRAFRGHPTTLVDQLSPTGETCFHDVVRPAVKRLQDTRIVVGSAPYNYVARYGQVVRRSVLSVPSAPDNSQGPERHWMISDHAIAALNCRATIMSWQIWSSTKSAIVSR